MRPTRPAGPGRRTGRRGSDHILLVRLYRGGGRAHRRPGGGDEMNHEILIETEVDGAEPYAALLRRVNPAALEAEGVSFPARWTCSLPTTRASGPSTGSRGTWTGHRRALLPHVRPGGRHAAHPGRGGGGPGHRPGAPGGHGALLERAQAQGAEYGHGPERETAYLAVHSVAPPAGLRPPGRGPQKARMRAREEAILNGLGIGRG